MNKEQLEAKAEAFADSIERRGCSLWSGLYKGYMYGHTAALKGIDLDQVVYVESVFNPTKYKLLKLIEGGTEIDHGFVKKTTIGELINHK